MTFFNDAAESMTGHDRNEVLGKHGTFILGEEQETVWRELRMCLDEGRPGKAARYGSRPPKAALWT